MKRALRSAVALAACLAGASAMVLEVAGAHALAPGFGTALNAWAAMITVALGGLACGYALGGLAADRWEERLAGTIFPALPTIAGACFAADALVWHRVATAFTGAGPRLGAILAAGVLFFVPFAFLGAVYPVAVKLWTRTLEEVGRRSGWLSAISAVGSLAGASAAGFLLVPRLSLETVFGLFSAALIAAGGVLFLLGGGRKAAGVAALLLACLPAFAPQRPPEEGALYRGPSLFGPVRVLDRGGVRFLLVSGTIQGACVKNGNESLFPYVQILGEMLRRNLPAERQDVLLVGLGAGLLPRALDAGSCETVEVDAAVLRVAERFFSFDASLYPVHVADGRAFLFSTRERYDAVVFDAYAGGNHPCHMLTKECFQLAKSRLRSGGILVVNFLGYVTGPDDRLVRALEKTLREVFERLDIFSSQPVEDYANAIFVAHGAEFSIDWPGGPYERTATFLDERPSRVLTDSRNPVSLWSASVERRWREESQLMLSAGRAR